MEGRDHLKKKIKNIGLKITLFLCSIKKGFLTQRGRQLINVAADRRRYPGPCRTLAGHQAEMQRKCSAACAMEGMRNRLKISKASKK